MSFDNEMDLGDIRSESSVQDLNFFVRFKVRLGGFWQGLSRGQKIGVSFGLGIAAVLILGVLAARAFWGGSQRIDSGNPLPGKKPTPLPSISLPVLDEPKDQVNPLNGNRMTKTAFDEAQKYQPIIVMVENHVASRPQSGFSQADIVYETLAEGGITRFLTVFWENAPQKIGPVRSMRKYFLDIASEYPEAPVMHIGQASSNNPETDAWGYIARYGIKSLPVVASGLFWRETRPGLALEHTAYSSLPQLREKAQARGWGIGPPELIVWKFKDGASKEDRPEEQKIQVNWGGWEIPQYQVVWEYDPETNSYARSYADGTQTVDADGKRIQAQTIVVQFTSQAVAPNEPDGKPRLINKLIGRGEALVFEDGGVIKANWEKADRKSRTVFTDESGQEIELVRGQIWVEIVPIGSKIDY